MVEIWRKYIPDGYLDKSSSDLSVDINNVPRLLYNFAIIILRLLLIETRPFVGLGATETVISMSSSPMLNTETVSWTR